MNRSEFMETLKNLLSDISDEERAEALLYYEDYFDDAGPEREQEIIEELGSPAKIASSIKADLDLTSKEARERGYFTEKGYEEDNLQEPKFEVTQGIRKEKDTTSKNSAYRNNTDDQGNRHNSSANFTENNYNTQYKNSYHNNERKENKGAKSILIILLCIFAIPVGIPMIVTAFALIVALGATVFALWIAIAAVSVALTFAGIVSTVVGIINLLSTPAMGVSITGMGLVLFGVGVLFIIGTLLLSTKVIPVIFRFVLDVCRLPFKNRRVAA